MQNARTNSVCKASHYDRESLFSSSQILLYNRWCQALLQSYPDHLMFCQPHPYISQYCVMFSFAWLRLSKPKVFPEMIVFYVKSSKFIFFNWYTQPLSLALLESTIVKILRPLPDLVQHLKGTHVYLQKL